MAKKVGFVTASFAALIFIGFIYLTNFVIPMASSQEDSNLALNDLHFINRGDLEVPDIIHDTNWVQTDTRYLAKKDDEIVHSAIYYEHTENNWNMSVHTIFGQEVFKAYSIRDDQGNLLEHWYYIKMHNDWFLVKSSNIHRYYPSGFVEISLLDEESKKAIFKAVYYKY